MTELTTVIIDTALQQFLEQGYEGATMDAVAVACGVSKHTLYRRYPNKALLFHDAVNRHTTHLISQLRAVSPPDSDPIAAIRLSVEMALAFATSRATVQLFRMCIGAVERFPEVGVQFSSIEERIVDVLEPLVQRAQAEGRFHPGPSRRTATHLYYALSSERWTHVLTGAAAAEDILAPEAFEEAWTVAMRGFAVEA